MMRNRFGLTNQIHEHDLPFIDRPDVLVQFFGQDGLVEKGGEATWVPPLPFYLELLGGLFNGDNETAFGLGNIKYPLVTGRARTFFELEDLGALQLGMSVANGLQPDRLNNLILGWDLKYKYVPEGWQHPLLTVAGELLYQMRRVNTPGSEATIDENGEEIPGTPGRKQTLNRVGWYAFGELQPFGSGWLSRFAAGFRYDWTEYPTSPGPPVGRAALPELHALGVPALPDRLQAHAGQYAGLLHEHRLRQRADQGRALLAVHVHSRRPPLASVLMEQTAMRTALRALALVLLALGVLAGGAAAADKIRVVATTTDLKALTEAVGGDLVEVDALARGNQNPHDLEVRPSLMVKVRRADLLVVNGLELDQWADVVVQGANNPRVIPGAPGRVDASQGIMVLEVPTTRVDRSMGDVHPVGNPHYSLDPGMAPDHHREYPRGARARRPAVPPRLRAKPHGVPRPARPGHGPLGEAARAVQGRQDRRRPQYVAVLSHPLRSGPGGHRSRIAPAFRRRPPTSTRLIALMKAERIKVVIMAPWSDQKLAERVAQDAGAKAVSLAPGVGAVKGTGHLSRHDRLQREDPRAGPPVTAPMQRASIPNSAGVYSDPVRADSGRHRRGMPPTPVHPATLIQHMKDDTMKGITARTLAPALR